MLERRVCDSVLSCRVPSSNAVQYKGPSPIYPQSLGSCIRAYMKHMSQMRTSILRASERNMIHLSSTDIEVPMKFYSCDGSNTPLHNRRVVLTGEPAAGSSSSAP